LVFTSTAITAFTMISLTTWSWESIAKVRDYANISIGRRRKAMGEPVVAMRSFPEGLKDSMVVGSIPAALLNIGVTGVLALAFILVGARVTRWKEA
jgi:hypothetical protein